MINRKIIGINMAKTFLNILFILILLILSCDCNGKNSRMRLSWIKIQLQIQFLITIPYPVILRVSMVLEMNQFESMITIAVYSISTRFLLKDQQRFRQDACYDRSNDIAMLEKNLPNYRLHLIL